MRSSRFLLAAVASALLLVGCGAPAPELPTSTTNTPTAVGTTPAAVRVGDPVLIAIPKLGVTDAVVPVGLAADGSMALPDVSETGWYTLGPKPGEPGPAVLAGHVDWDGAKGALGRIGELAVGDQIVVTDTSGAARVFRVYSVRPGLLKSQYATVTVPIVFGARTTADLELVTCSGPVSAHEYRDNTVVSARLARP